MICETCKTPSDEGARFCSGCGGELAHSTASLQARENAQVSAAVAPAGAPQDDEVTHVRSALSANDASVAVMGSRSNNSVMPAIAGDSIIGRTIENKYRIDAKLGAGGMGAVYSAHRLLIGDEVAVKILHPQHVSEPQATERFRREAQAAARLKHPNAVSIYDFGVTSDGLVYLVMELVEGQSLREIIKQQGPLTQSAAAEVINQVCAALDEAHRQQIVHRDLKPDNIVVKTMLNGLRVKVLDFGIAKLRDLTAGNLTQTGSVMGTPHYMSPEQCLGEELDSRSDIYSLGVVLYEMLIGVVPFNSPTSTAVVVQHVNQAPPSLRAMNLSVSPRVEAVVLHALAKRPEDRPQSAAALANELNAAVSSVSATASFASTPSPSFASGQSQSFSGNQPAAQGMTATVVLRTPVSGSKSTYPGQTSPIQPAYATQGHQTTTTKRPTAIFAALGGVALIGVAIAIYFAFFSFSAKKAIIDEVRKGNLVKPQGNSAYDLYNKYKNGDLKSGDLDEIAREAVAPMEKRGEEIFTNVKKDPQVESEDEWSESIRLYTWLNELRANKIYEGRRYCSEGRLALLKKDYDGAMSAFQRSLERDPSSALTLNSIGRVYYLGRKDKTSAQEYYRRSTTAEPNWIAPWVNLGALCIETRDYATGESALRRAIQLNNQKASPHNLLGQILENEDRLCEAVAEYQIAFDSATANPTATVNVDAIRRKIATLNSRGFICGD
jgi:serine/threonine protein kinase/tetratricopeptide (TPR) repeat protein